MNIKTTRDSLLSQLAQIRQTYDEKLALLSEQQLLWKPAPDRWGIVECLAHLNMASQYYVRQLQLKWEQNSTSGPQTSEFEMSLNGKLILRFLDPKSTVKIPAPSMFKPKPYHLDVPKVKQTFVEILEDFSNFIEKSDRIDWNLRVLSPFSTWLKFRLGDVLIFVTAHLQRHLNQALKVMQESAFAKVL